MTEFGTTRALPAALLTLSALGQHYFGRRYLRRRYLRQHCFRRHYSRQRYFDSALTDSVCRRIASAVGVKSSMSNALHFRSVCTYLRTRRVRVYPGSGSIDAEIEPI